MKAKVLFNHLNSFIVLIWVDMSISLFNRQIITHSKYYIPYHYHYIPIPYTVYNIYIYIYITVSHAKSPSIGSMPFEFYVHSKSAAKTKHIMWIKVSLYFLLVEVMSGKRQSVFLCLQTPLRGKWHAELGADNPKLCTYLESSLIIYLSKEWRACVLKFIKPAIKY